ncbi:MAG: SRPBCC domain-containing protein [Lewinella sp.]|jgi:uncharacterized protein YndB with AHSA1/START domain|uniref:SRPBCC domain-containing protein n=1 Tax=Lewinella sp. TaxID=2004506 RepID=UPI003D6BC734
MQQQSIQQQIDLPATIEKSWRLLTESVYTKQYMFNCEVKSTWAMGSSVIWQGNYQGYDAYQKGNVLAIQPGRSLKYSTFDPNFGLEDVPENYIHVSYHLKEKEGFTELTIINETFDGNKERLAHIRQGWEMVMVEMKKIMEAEKS